MAKIIKRILNNAFGSEKEISLIYKKKSGEREIQQTPIIVYTETLKISRRSALK